MGADWLSKGTPVWVAGSGGDGESEWRHGVVAGPPGASCAVALDEGGQATVPSNSLAPANPAFLDLASDLTHLTYLNEPGLLHTLRRRFAADAIYTAAGPVLVAINPFRPLPLYGADAVQRYSQRGAAGAAAEGGQEPHIFLTADRAYQQMVSLQQSQSVLITGESGAGKTETTKFVMRYLAARAGGLGMEDRVLMSNPILEAFGNAKTGLNNNSSRFGRLIKIFFAGGGRRGIAGARVHAYLLEKSRVVGQQPGERCFHVFYQLCRGASEDERARYGLPPVGAAPAAFAYLSGSGCTAVEGVDDAADFGRLKAALTAVGIAEERQGELFSQVAAVLHLGNVRFSPLHDDAAEVAEGSGGALRQAAALLGVAPAALAAALTTRRMAAGGERITRHLSAAAAADNRDALAKALYAAAFSWLVAQVNAALAVGNQQAGADVLTISLLDIYGFEQFQRNSFETLCINFANERLQGQFAAHMLALEQAAYEEEGIDWAHIDWTDNQDCVELIEARPPAGLGLLSLLDEECMMPRGSDATFAAKLQAAHGAHPRFGCPARAAGPSFTIRHFAGPVTYSAEQFLDKNRDMLSKDLVELLAASSAPLVAALAAEMEGRAGGERRGSATVGARFRDQLRDLIQRLDSTRLHFVRCLKPNAAQAAAAFDPALVLHQLRCCGVLEVARIAQAGYPTRYRHAEFARRYAGLLPEFGAGPLPTGVPPADVCRRLLAHFGVDPSQFQLGRSKLFCRAGLLGRLEDAAARMHRAALLIQSTWRMSVCRRAFLASRAAAVAVQAAWRGAQARAAFADLLSRHRAALRIQGAARGWAARRRFRAALRGVLALQAAWRRHAARSRAAARREAAREEHAAADAGAGEEEEGEEETLEAIQREFGLDAAQLRRTLAQWREHGEAFQRWRAAGAPSPGSARGASSAGEGRAASVSPPRGEDSGLLLEVAAANADVAALQQRLEGLQLEHQQLARHSEDVREENRLLQRALSALQRAVDERADAAAAAHCRAVLAPLLPPTGVGHPAPSSPAKAAQPGRGTALGQALLPPPSFSVRADASRSSAAAGRLRGGSTSDSDSDTISLMSLGDVEGSQCTDAAPSPPPGAMPSAVGGEGSALLGCLSRELDKKRTLLDDDADFIREVSAGLSAAPGMDPGQEYERLVARYKSWKKEFKERLASTQRAVRQLKRDERRPSGTPRSSASHGGGATFSLGRLRSSSGGGDAARGGGASEDGGRAGRAARMLLPFKSRRG